MRRDVAGCRGGERIRASYKGTIYSVLSAALRDVKRSRHRRNERFTGPRINFSGTAGLLGSLPLSCFHGASKFSFNSSWTRIKKRSIVKDGLAAASIERAERTATSGLRVLGSNIVIEVESREKCTNPWQKNAVFVLGVWINFEGLHYSCGIFFPVGFISWHWNVWRLFG